MLTLGDVQVPTGPIARVAAYCPTSAEFISLINQAQRKLLRRGDWSGTVVPIYVCVANGCVVWPRYVQEVRRINMCNRTIPVRNLWYEFLERGNRCLWSNWLLWPQSKLEDRGRTSVFQDIQGDGRTVRAYARCQADLGKTVTIFGLDNNGQILQTNNGDGTWSLGVVLVLQTPFASTSTFVRSIDYVLKDATQCPVDLYAYNATTNLLEDLAHYEPSETRPSYSKTRLLSHFPTCGTGTFIPPQGCCGTTRSVVALVKLRFIEAQVPTDLLILDNEDALQMMVQSLKLREKNDYAAARALENEAVFELNRQLENDSPDDTFSVEDDTLGPHVWSNQAF